MALQESWSEETLKTLNGPVSPEFRKQAFDSFSALGLPSTKQEDWKYTNVSELAKRKFKTPSSKEFKSDEVNSFIFDEYKGARLVFLNGRFDESLSSFAELPKGVVVSSISEALKGDSKDIVQERLGKLASTKEEAFVALNTAFLTDGTFIKISKNVKLDEPVQILQITTKDEEDINANLRVLVVAEEGAEANIIERFVGLSSKAYFTSSVAEFSIAPNANVKHVRLQEEGEKAYHYSSIHLYQERDSHFETHTFSLGGKLVRNEIRPVLDGENIMSVLNGLSILSDEQHVDNFTIIDHAKPHSESSELYKGIYADKSNGVFSGQIIVREDAQKTNAFQANNSLLLSNDAKVETRPQLKIWADDVRCSHGATIGQLDDDALFYLRARGIPKDEARNMLIKAFASDVIEGIETPAVESYIESKLAEKLGA